MTVAVRDDGCILLGNSVSCDGFCKERPIRIQTHAHSDHMLGFESSKGNQEILLSKPTLDLLIAEFNADLPYRNNIKTIEADCVAREFYGVKVEFYPTGHLIGGILPVIEDNEFGRVAYTSDFSWPLAELPKNIDTLVVDATYGDPANVRNYKQDSVVDEFISTVSSQLHSAGKVVITGHRGRLQHAAQLLANNHKEPFIFTKNGYKTLDVFMKYRGFDINAIEFGTEEANKIIRNRDNCIIFAEHRDRAQIDQINADKRILLSPFMVPKEEPIVDYGEIVRVALTDHADFNETIELIKTIGPDKIIADGTRGGNADCLAEFVREELQMEATSETQKKSKNWGR